MPVSMPIYRAVPTEKVDERARAFGANLIGTQVVPDQPTSFVDPVLFMHLPTRKLGPGPVGEDGVRSVVEALDVEALIKMPVISEKAVIVARRRFRDALSWAGLEPENDEIHDRLGRFEMFDHARNVVISRPISIRLWLERDLGGIRREGPGAKITATFDCWGNVTHYRFAWREVQRTEKACAVITEEEAKSRFIERYRQRFESFKAEVEPVYYLPPVEKTTVSQILPHYRFTARVEESEDKGGGEIILVETLTPAVDGGEYKPEACLRAKVVDGEVHAEVEVKGGQCPYSFGWRPGPYEIERFSDSITYRLEEDVCGSELVAVRVIDANGISTVAAQTLEFERTTATDSEAAIPAYAFGTENPESRDYPDEELGLVDKLRQYHGGYQRGFSCCGESARQRHFKHPEDRSWIDNTNLGFFVGHEFGNAVGFQFTGKHVDEIDWILFYSEAIEEWGNHRLNWLALHSCNVLRSLLWSRAFDGLHLLLGFQTGAAVNPQFSESFAEKMLTHRLPVAAAWFAAIADQQTNDQVGAVMGAIRRGDHAFNFNDRYSGIGPTGPDIAAGEIEYFFRISGP